MGVNADIIKSSVIYKIDLLYDEFRKNANNFFQQINSGGFYIWKVNT